MTAAETTITNLIQLHVIKAQIWNQEQTRVQNDTVNLVQEQIQPEKSNKSKIQITRNFIPDPGAQTSKTADKRPKEFQQPPAKLQNLNKNQPQHNLPKPNQSKRPKQNQRYRDISPTP